MTDENREENSPTDNSSIPQVENSNKYTQQEQEEYDRRRIEVESLVP